MFLREKIKLIEAGKRQPDCFVGTAWTGGLAGTVCLGGWRWQPVWVAEVAADGWGGRRRRGASAGVSSGMLSAPEWVPPQFWSGFGREGLVVAEEQTGRARAEVGVAGRD